MAESKQQAPHFYVQTEVTMDGVSRAASRLNEARSDRRASRVTAALVRACAAALRAAPRFNGVWTEDGLLQADEINIGIAIALEDGLLAPALLGADRLDLSGPAVGAARPRPARARATSDSEPRSATLPSR